MSANEKPTKRSNDSTLETVKWVATIALTAMGAGIVALALFAGLSLNAEKSSLRVLEENVKHRMDEQIQRVDVALSRVERKPEVVLLSRRGEPLNGKTIEAILTRTGSGLDLRFTLILKNVGTATTDPLFIKWYSKKPLILSRTAAVSSDEANYDYEGITDPKDFPEDVSRVLPAQASFTFNIKCLASGIKQEPAKYPILLKIYYGSTSPHVSEFFIEVTDKT